MGRAGVVYRGFDRDYFLFFLADLTMEEPVNNFIMAFVVALVAFGLLFLGLDFAIMKAQGLSLFFHQ
ncbi:MAG: hypothetical protein GY802_02400 [Gammaproteobacteria bacterium]|nr:hypothetical protein [Gammaproteobacteria bacterium]